MPKENKSTAVVADHAVVVPNPLDGITFNSIPIQHAQRLLTPFVRHQPTCLGTTPEECTCGLRTAIDELARLDLVGNRYGFVE